MRRIFPIVSLFLVSISSFVFCSKRSRDTPIPVLQPEDKLAFHELINSIELIPLEFSEEFGFGEVEKVLVFDDKVFLLDPTFSKSIQVFDLNGKFLKSYNSFQKTTIWDFVIEKGSGELILYTLGKNFERFSPEGQLLNSGKNLGSLSKLLLEENGNLLAYTGFSEIPGLGNFNLVSFSLDDFSLKETHLPFEEAPSIGLDRVKNYALSRNDVYFTLPFSSEILVLSGNGQIKNSIQLDFEDRILSVDQFNSSEGLVEKPMTTGLDGLVYSRGKLFYHFVLGEKAKFGVIDLIKREPFELIFEPGPEGLMYQISLMGYMVETDTGYLSVIDLDYLRPILGETDLILPDYLKEVLDSEALFAILKVNFND
jgi:hypothetical protein